MIEVPAVEANRDLGCEVSRMKGHDANERYSISINHVHT